MNIQSRTVLTLVLASLTALASQSGIARDSSADIGEFNFTGDAVVLPLVRNSMHPKAVVILTYQNFVFG